MGQLLPAIKIIGKIVGAALIANEVDDLAGSPVKESLGIGPEPMKVEIEQGVNTTVAPREGYAAETSDRARGFQNYLRTLQSLAPTYAAMNRSKLRKNYNRQIDRREDDLKAIERKI